MVSRIFNWILFQLEKTIEMRKIKPFTVNQVDPARIKVLTRLKACNQIDTSVEQIVVLYTAMGSHLLDAMHILSNT